MQQLPLISPLQGRTPEGMKDSVALLPTFELGRRRRRGHEIIGCSISNPAPKSLSCCNKVVVTTVNHFNNAIVTTILCEIVAENNNDLP
jgi:hypothetical protein